MQHNEGIEEKGTGKGKTLQQGKAFRAGGKHFSEGKRFGLVEFD